MTGLLSTSVGFSIKDDLTGLDVIQEFVLHGVPGTAPLNAEELLLSNEAPIYSIATDIGTNFKYTKIAVGSGASKWAQIEGEHMAFAKRVDFVSGTEDIYIGLAATGSSEGSPVWRIRKLELNVEDDVTQLWANGDALFDKVWDDRSTLTYT